MRRLRGARLFHFGMRVTEGTRYLPMAIFETPDVDEVGLTNNPMVLRVGVQEAVGADLDGSVIVYGMDLERARHELADELAADVVASSIQHGLAAEG